MTTQTETANTILARYAADIAVVAEEQPARTLTDFVDQLYTAAGNVENTDITGGDELEIAATFLTASKSANDVERTVLLGQAAKELRVADVYGMASEYRDAT